MRKINFYSKQKFDPKRGSVFNICITQKRYSSVPRQTLELLIYPGLPMSTMVYYRVVSTKLTEEEHGRLLDVCNVRGCPPSALIRDAIMKIINTERETQQKVDPTRIQTRELIIKSQQMKKEFPNSELEKLLGTK